MAIGSSRNSYLLYIFLSHENNSLATYEPDPNAHKKMSKSFKITFFLILIAAIWGALTQFGSYRQIKHRVLMFFSTTVSSAQNIRSFRSPNPMGQNIGLITQNPSVTPLYNDEKESVYRL